MSNVKSLGGGEAELLQMNSHVHQKNQTGDDELQRLPVLPRAQHHGQRFVLVSTLERDQNVHDGAKSNVLLNDVGLQTETGPIQADVKEAITSYKIFKIRGCVKLSGVSNYFISNVTCKKIENFKKFVHN